MTKEKKYSEEEIDSFFDRVWTFKEKLPIRRTDEVEMSMGKDYDSIGRAILLHHRRLNINSARDTLYFIWQDNKKKIHYSELESTILLSENGFSPIYAKSPYLENGKIIIDYSTYHETYDKKYEIPLTLLDREDLPEKCLPKEIIKLD